MLKGCQEWMRLLLENLGVKVKAVGMGRKTQSLQAGQIYKKNTTITLELL
jgi:hypothetical protein